VRVKERKKTFSRQTGRTGGAAGLQAERLKGDGAPAKAHKS